MNKRALWTASLIAAIAALAVPAGASAGGFNHEGNPIVGAPEGEVTGFTGIGTGLGTFGCVTHAEGTITTEDAHAEGVEITTSECEGTGALTGCELANDEVTGLPWTVTPSGGTSIVVDDVEVHMEFEECPLAEINITFEEVTATPDDPDAISSVEISGEGVIDTLGQELEAEAFGELEVVGADTGTYGIE